MIDTPDTQPTARDTVYQYLKAAHPGLAVSDLLTDYDAQAVAAERAAHEEHRRQLADALGEAPRRDWEYLVRSAGASRGEAAQRATRLVEQQRAVCEALGGNTVDWPEAIRRVRKAVADRDGQRAEVRRLRGRVDDAEDAERRMLEQRQEMAAERYAWQERGDRAERERGSFRTAAEDQTRRADAAEAALARVREAARLHRQGLLSITELHAVIGPVSGDQPAEAPCTHVCGCGHDQQDHTTSGYCNACGVSDCPNDGHYPSDCPTAVPREQPVAPVVFAWDAAIARRLLDLVSAVRPHLARALGRAVSLAAGSTPTATGGEGE